MSGREDEPIGWHARDECYLGASWPTGEILQKLYSRFDDSWFLADIPQLDIGDEASCNEWAGFFCWLGVWDHPRLLEAGSHSLNASSPSPFRSEGCWPEYLSAHQEDFQCQNPRRSHGVSRRLQQACSIQHFTAIAENEIQRAYWACTISLPDIGARVIALTRVPACLVNSPLRAAPRKISRISCCFNSRIPDGSPFKLAANGLSRLHPQKSGCSGRPIHLMFEAGYPRCPWN